MHRSEYKLSAALAPRTIPDLVIYGHAGFDISLMSGRSIRAPGGAAYYATLAASIVNRSTGIVTVLGKDFPISWFQSLQIDTSGILLKDGDSALFCQEYGAGNEVINLSVHLNACEELLPDLIPAPYLAARFFFVATAPPRQQAHVLDWLVERQFGGVIAIDTTISYVDDFHSLLREHEDNIGIVFVNQEEYQRLRWLPARSKSLVVKRGARGASLYDSEVWTDVSAPAIDKVCNTTGAGDILAGACLAGLAAGDEFKIALSRGVELATKSVVKHDAEHLRECATSF
jgi:sugar/nucleoside kinase (ribokinase family)